jgi:hypothetical protein
MALGFTFHLPGYFPSFFNLPLVKTVETGYIDTTIYPSFYKHVVVEYSIPSHWGNCLFDIYRGESQAGPWEKITPTPITGNFFKDTGTMDFSKFMQGWYLVECQLPDGRRIQGPASTWQNKRNNWVELRAREIERRETILLEKFTGVKTLVFRRKQFGMRCRECWDLQTEKITKDNCKTCLGTSFDGGYNPGFETLFQYEPANNEVVLEERGKLEPSIIPAWTISYPHVEPEDVVVRVPDWKVFRVNHTQSTELQTKSVRQTVALVELSKESIEFELTKQAMPENYR